MDRYGQNILALLNKLQRPIFFVSVLIFGFTIYTAYKPERENPFQYSSLTAREIAIREAKAKGLSEYSFTTNFIPGIGNIDKDQVLNDLKSQASDEAEIVTNE